MSSGIPNALSAMHQDHSGSLRFLDASFSARAVRSDPAAVSSHLALDGDLLLPSSHYDPVGLRFLIFTRLIRFTYVTARASLCLRLTHVVTLYGAFFVKGSNLAPMFFCGTGSGHLAGRRRSGLRDNQRGNPPSCAAHGRDTTLYSVAPYEAHHDAVIRILGEVPRRRPHSPCRRLKPW